MNYSGIKTKPGLVVKYVSSNFRTKTQPASYDKLVKEREPGSRIWITEQGFTLESGTTSISIRWKGKTYVNCYRKGIAFIQKVVTPKRTNVIDLQKYTILLVKST